MKGKFIKVMSLMVIVAMLAAGLAACGSSSDNAANDGAAAGDTATSDGGAQKVLSYAISGDPETMDPTLNNYSASSIFLQQLFRGLFKLGVDNQPVNVYCEDYTVDETGTKYVFTLIKDGKWSDGSPVVAGDFEYAWKRALNPDVASPCASDLYYVKNGQAYNEGSVSADEVGVKAIDEYTLEVELEGPTAFFLDLLCSTAFYPVKEEVVEADGTWTKSVDTYITNGPFKLKEMKPQEKYVMEKDYNYILAEGVNLDILEYLVIDTPEAQLANYKNNTIQVADGLSQEGYAEFEGTAEYNTSDRIGVYYYDFNTSREIFQDARVRRAFSMAIDREIIVKNVLQSTFSPALAFVPEGISDTENPAVEFRVTAGDVIKENIEEAQKLMAEAGYPNGEGFPEVELVTQTSQSNKDIAQAVQAMWQDNLGVKVNIVTYDSGVYWDQLAEGNFDVIRDGFTGSYNDPLALLETWSWPKQENESRWHNPKYVELLDENKLTTDESIRMKNAIEAEKILAEDAAFMPIYFMNSTYLVKENITGVYKNYISHIYFENVDIIQ